MPDYRLSIIVEGIDKATEPLGKIGGSLQGIGTAALAGVGIAGGALAGLAVKGVTDFAAFQGKMNEVFTLLPGISQSAMANMTGQVKQFAKDFGVLPENVVPALYQSLSAGVPPDNVFAFLETAQKAAKGGVTDLETAVDGISSVVNAYGADVLSAANASDLMFTAVRLGKTDFTQLSSSLFNVIPTAASLGVQFGDVTAALASLTAAGTPTSVATTQIRAALVEASKGGTKLDQALKGLYGKSFPELVASGMDIGTIFNGLRSSMPDQKFKDLFGSVEAVNAVLGITGPNAAGFTANLDAMRQSAGATDAAFAQMNQGLGPAFDRIRATFSTFMLDVGAKLAPFVQLAADQLGVVLPQALDLLSGSIDGVAGLFDAFAVGMEGDGGIVGGLSNLLYSLDTVSPAFDMLGDAVVALGPIIDPLVAIIGQNLQPILVAVAGVLGGAVVLAIGSAIAAFLAAAAPVLALVAVGAALYAAWQSNFAGIQSVVTSVLAQVWTVIQTVISTVTAFWQTNGDAITTQTQTLWQSVYTLISTTLQLVWTIISTVLNTILAFWKNHGTELMAFIKSAWDLIYSVIKTALDLISGIIKTVTDLIKGDWKAVWQDIQNLSATFIKNIIGVLENSVSYFANAGKLMINAVADAWHAFTGWAGIGGGVIDGIIDGIKGGISSLASQAAAAARAALTAAKQALGINSPSREFMALGRYSAEGMELGLKGGAPGVAAAARETARQSISNARSISLTYYRGSQDERSVRDDLRTAALLMG